MKPGDRIREAREKLYLSQKALAHRAGVDVAEIRCVEKNWFLPTAAICKAAGLDPAELDLDATHLDRRPPAHDPPAKA